MAQAMPWGQYGVRFWDGSVAHRWNGRTQRQRAEEYLAYVKAEYPRDAERMALVWRASRDDEWDTVTES